MKDTIADFFKEKNTHISKIPLNEIHLNELNFYETSDPEGFLRKAKALAQSIRTYGLYNPIVVVKDGSGYYNIISGNTRFKAVQMNFEAGYGDGTIDCIVNYKDANLSEEEMKSQIVHANIQRDKTDEEVYEEIKVLEQDFKRLYQMGEVTGRKDDWIALQLGVSGRTIRNYRKSVEEKRSGETANNDEQASAKKEQTPLEKQMIRTLKALEKFQKMASKDNDKDDVCNAIQNCMDTLKWYGLQYGLLQGEER